MYAYGKKPPEWLSTRLILNQFNVAHPHRAYRDKVQRYAQEEVQLWEDFRHGFILGSLKFIESVRDRFLQEMPTAEVPQQLRLSQG